jgi:transposase-like protein
MVIETGRPIAEVAHDLGIHHGTLGNWVNAWWREHTEPDQLANRSGVPSLKVRAELAKHSRTLDRLHDRVSPLRQRDDHRGDASEHSGQPGQDERECSEREGF